MGKYRRLYRVDKPKGKLGDVIRENCRSPGRRGTITQNERDCKINCVLS